MGPARLKVEGSVLGLCVEGGLGEEAREVAASRAASRGLLEDGGEKELGVL